MCFSFFLLKKAPGFLWLFVRLYNLAKKCSIVYQSDCKISNLIITIAFSLAKKQQQKKHRDLKADICFL